MSKRVSDAIHLKNLYTKDIVVRFVNIYPVDSDLAVGQLYLFYGQLGPDGWGETTSKHFTVDYQNDISSVVDY